LNNGKKKNIRPTNPIAQEGWSNIQPIATAPITMVFLQSCECVPQHSRPATFLSAVGQ